MISDCESPIISHLPFQPSQPFRMGDLSPRTRSVTSPPSKRISKRIFSNGKGKMSNNKWKMVRRLLLTAYRFRFWFAQLFQSSVSLSAKGTLRMLSEYLRKVSARFLTKFFWSQHYLLFAFVNNVLLWLLLASLSSEVRTALAGDE